MKNFLGGLILGAIGGLLGAYFGLSSTYRGSSRAEQLKADHAKLRIDAGEAKDKAEKAQEKLTEAEDAARKAKESYEQALAKLEEKHEGDLRSLKDDVATAKRDAETFRKELDQLRHEARQARAASGSVPVVAKLITLRDAHRPLEVAIARDFSRAMMLLSQAKEGPPQADQLREVANRLKKRTSELGESVRKLYSYVSRNSRALKEVGADPVAQLADLSSDELKLVEAASEAIIDAVEGMRLNKAQVFADKEWQDCDASAVRGDYVHVKGLRKSRWRMTSRWSDKRGEGAIGGWERDYESKVYGEARAGALIMKIGLSDKIWPAYFRKPIVADESGTISCRMNDKLSEGNGGKVYVEITTMSGDRLEGALAAVDEAFKGVTWLKW